MGKTMDEHGPKWANICPRTLLCRGWPTAHLEAQLCTSTGCAKWDQGGRTTGTEHISRTPFACQYVGSMGSTGTNAPCGPASQGGLCAIIRPSGSGSSLHPWVPPPSSTHAKNHLTPDRAGTYELALSPVAWINWCLRVVNQPASVHAPIRQRRGPGPAACYVPT